MPTPLLRGQPSEPSHHAERGSVENGGGRRSQTDGTAREGEVEDGSGGEVGRDCFKGGRAPGRLSGEEGSLDQLATRVFGSSPCPISHLHTAVSALGK